MKRNFMVIGLILLAGWLMLFSFSAGAEDQSGEKKEKAPPPNLFAYKPPMRGAPESRMGGGTRGILKKGFPYLTALVPVHAGLTTQSSPTLYWYLSEPSPKPIKFTLNDATIGKTLVRVDVRPDETGIRRIDLSEHKVNLSPEKEYSWFITMIVDPEKPQQNLLSEAWIQRVSPSERLTKNLAETDSAAAYAEEGIWYDALAERSRQIEAEPGNAILRKQRAFLLESVGLSEVVEFERAR